MTQQTTESNEAIDVASQPFVGRWQNLISTTNWEKGKIIFDWREALVESGAPSTEYSDEAWAQRVGGVTSPHVGRLRRVYELFGSNYETYPGLYWSHFLAAMDWDDAEMWLEGAMRSGWSVSGMREQRWQATGAAEADRPEQKDIVDADTDEDVIMPAQGGGGSNRLNDGADEITAGPAPEDPDFGEPQEMPVPSGDRSEQAASPSEIVQPFAGLPELPDDLSEALEMFKLSILRHKSASWADVTPETVMKTLEGLRVLTVFWHSPKTRSPYQLNGRKHSLSGGHTTALSFRLFCCQQERKTLRKVHGASIIPWLFYG